MYNTKLGTSSCCQCPTECYGETDTLEIIKEFRQLYEKKLHQIDIHGGGDALKMKLKVQQKWIEDLTEQTELMAKVVKELESEASERVQMLEEQLQKSAQYASEVMKRYQMYDFPFDSDKSFQRIDCLENDVKNLLEFIRRVRDDCEWSVNGLEFYNVCYCDLFGKNNENASCRCSEMNKSDGQGGGEEISRDNQEAIIEQLRAEIRHLRSMGNPIDTNKQLKRKDEEIEKLKASMLDMRTALTEEVAYKHDMISMLKKDIQQLEERCVQSDKQTAFKDDIIKELRKEIKQLKQLLTNSRLFFNILQDKKIYNIEHSLVQEEAKIAAVVFIKDKGLQTKKSATYSKPQLLLSKSESDLLEATVNEVPVKETMKYMSRYDGNKRKLK